MPRVGEITAGDNDTQMVGVMRPLTLESCKSLLLTHHYSHRLPSAVKLCFGEVNYGPPTRTVLSCCIFSLATGRWPEELWELTRLVRLPNHKRPLTALISKAVGHLRREKAIDLLVSFADSEEDHHGGIYQASSWLYDGIRGTRLDGFNIDGNFVPARTCNAIHGTSSEEGLAAKLPGRSVVPHYDDGKHCYWKALSKEGMKKALRLGLASRAYPKPMLDGSASGVNNSLLPGHLRKGLIELPCVGERRLSESELVAASEAARRASAIGRPAKAI